MTQDRFLKMMERPELLNSVTYEELKTLVLAYPYTHNLRYLLAIKSRQENHSEFAKNLAAASTYSLDRKRLFQILAPKMLAPKRVEEKTQVLELKPIEKVREELEAKTPVSVEILKKEEAKSLAATPPMPISEIPDPRFVNFQKVDKSEIPEPPKIKEKEVLFDFSEIMQRKKEAAATQISVEKPAAEPAKVEILEKPEPEIELPNVEILEKPELSEPVKIEILEKPKPEIELPQTEILGKTPPVEPAKTEVLEKPISVVETPKIEIFVKPLPEVVPFNQTPILVFAPPQPIESLDLKPNFDNWLSQFRLPTMHGQSPAAKKSKLSPLDFFQNTELVEEEKLRSGGRLLEKSTEKPGEKSEARMLAERSVIENQDLVSETLARLYVRQGYFEKAISMYQKLSLAIPEKKQFFVAEIEKLKKSN